MTGVATGILPKLGSKSRPRSPIQYLTEESSTIEQDDQKVFSIVVNCQIELELSVAASALILAISAMPF